MIDPQPAELRAEPGAASPAAMQSAQARVIAAEMRDAALQLQRRLARYNALRIVPRKPTGDWTAEVETEAQMRLEEGAFLEELRASIAAQALTAPRQADAFVRWFERLEDHGPGQHDALFDWLAERASLAQMRWFLAQEVAGEAGFDDLLAYTQVKLPQRPKLEAARNFWDEMGRGHAKGMHGPMLSRLVTELELQPTIETTVCEALALANAMLGMALNRRYAYHAIGALGVIEQTAPGRVRKVGAGLARLGIDAHQRVYFDLHGAIDVRHAQAWNAEVIAPLVAADGDCARYIAEGALMRLSCGARCFERYRAELWTSRACTVSETA